MYVPRHFAVGDPAEVVTMLRTAAFGHLVAVRDGEFEASPLPFLVDDELTTVRAHVARANPIWRLAPTPACLAVTVADAYVSPSWYPSKQEHGTVVPTWNYEVVYVHGDLVAHDSRWTAQMVRELTDAHERGRPEPWSVDDAPDGYVEQLGRGIVGISLTVTRVEAKRKLSQNKSDADALGAAAGLATSGRERDHSIGSAMRSVRSDP